jgi:hypothetical protein
LYGVSGEAGPVWNTVSLRGGSDGDGWCPPFGIPKGEFMNKNMKYSVLMPENAKTSGKEPEADFRY